MLTIKKILRQTKMRFFPLVLSIILGWWHEDMFIKSEDDRKLGGTANSTLSNYDSKLFGQAATLDQTSMDKCEVLPIK